jgi:hypothetical protein
MWLLEAEEEDLGGVMLECVSLAAATAGSRYLLFTLNNYPHLYISMKQHAHFYVTSAGIRPNADLGSTASPS